MKAVSMIHITSDLLTSNGPVSIPSRLVGLRLSSAEPDALARQIDKACSVRDAGNDDAACRLVAALREAA